MKLASAVMRPHTLLQEPVKRFQTGPLAPQIPLLPLTTSPEFYDSGSGHVPRRIGMGVSGFLISYARRPSHFLPCGIFSDPDKLGNINPKQQPIPFAGSVLSVNWSDRCRPGEALFPQFQFDFPHLLASTVDLCSNIRKASQAAPGFMSSQASFLGGIRIIQHLGCSPIYRCGSCNLLSRETTPSQWSAGIVSMYLPRFSIMALVCSGCLAQSSILFCSPAGRQSCG